MTFRPKIWQPIAIVLSAANLVAVGFAAGAAEAWHAGVHAGLALAFGLWAQKLRQRAAVGEVEGGLELQAGLESLEIEVGELRRDLVEVQERLDFTERMLTQGREVRGEG
jgi:hypothetical protein